MIEFSFIGTGDPLAPSNQPPDSRDTLLGWAYLVSNYTIISCGTLPSASDRCNSSRHIAMT